MMPLLGLAGNMRETGDMFPGMVVVVVTPFSAEGGRLADLTIPLRVPAASRGGGRCW
jgi:hypothetical protein